MGAFTIEAAHLWVEYLLRFSHLVAGIAWIGSSFYFIWLDSSFTPPEVPRRNVDGELYMVHGGFYYQVEKRKIYPGELPKVLHWFKWEATLTWITGFMLFVFLYWLRGASLLVDASVRSLSQGEAILLSLGIIIGAWLLYDYVLWNARLIKVKMISTLLSAFAGAGLIYGLTSTFSGRGAFILTGVIFGSLMLLNVWVRILPGQAKMIRDAQAGQVPDYTLSLKSKTRSVHNTYFTFPVLFIMLSNHYPLVYNHPHRALLLIILAVSGAMVRHTMVTKVPKERWLLAPAAVGLLALVFVTGTPTAPLAQGGNQEPVEWSHVSSILQTRCYQCHSSHPTDDVYTVAPKGVIFETPSQVMERADLVELHVVTAKSMPLANKTGMLDEERAVLARWLTQQRALKDTSSSR